MQNTNGSNDWYLWILIAYRNPEMYRSVTFSVPPCQASAVSPNQTRKSLLGLCSLKKQMRESSYGRRMQEQFCTPCTLCFDQRMCICISSWVGRLWNTPNFTFKSWDCNILFRIEMKWTILCTMMEENWNKGNEHSVTYFWPALSLIQCSFWHRQNVLGWCTPTVGHGTHWSNTLNG